MPYQKTLNALGVPVRFESNRSWLLAHAKDAYGGLPALDNKSATIHVRLLANNDPHQQRLDVPPLATYFGTAAMTSAVFTPSDMLVCALHQGEGFVTVSPAMAHMSYIIRYEMIEFAVYRLLAHILQAVGLHGAAITRGGKTRLLFGDSGAGKSTLVMACLLQGFQLVGEDALFVLPGHEPELRGVPTYVHLLEETLSFFPDLRLSKKECATITRRSGRQKLEVDTRNLFRHTPRVSAPLGTLIFISQRRGSAAKVRLISNTRARALLDRQQPFARTSPGWDAAQATMLQYPTYELELGPDPHQAAELLAGID